MTVKPPTVFIAQMMVFNDRLIAVGASETEALAALEATFRIDCVHNGTTFESVLEHTVGDSDWAEYFGADFTIELPMGGGSIDGTQWVPEHVS